MNRIRNKKFLSLVNLLKNSTNTKKDYLEQIQFKDNYTFKIPYRKNNNRVLLDLFKDQHIQKHSYIEKIREFPKKPRSNKKSFRKTERIEKSNILYLDNLTKNKDLKLIYSVKKGDYFSDIFFKSIDPLYDTLYYYEKKEYIKKFKLKIIDIFNKQLFYKKYDYSTKDFKKSDLDHYFTSNLPITLGMLKVYADVLSVNLIYKNTNNTNQYLNRFDPNRATVLIYESNDKIYSVKSSTTYVRGIILKNFIKFDQKPIKEILQKMKINELHNIARMLNLSTKKKGKVGKINKKKDDLIEEILI